MTEYEQLYSLLQAQADVAGLNNSGNPVVRCEINSNKTCSLVLSVTRAKLTFVLGRMGEEYKIGYAYYPGGMREPEWIDDVDADNFTEKFARQLIWTNFQLPA
ncbi:hypothetical protein [Thiomicrospira cyclica]|uniref:Uncharacterized protein n=1 Tax=Thiomicrospira cyclica (strain DSM 14477 / JCM 11371 / ALM1) TaxID=717773 RepID=F6D9H7_THICA|nr:hypothetical protein [Thiomicrospira cyclica]AEG30934.1 hypothetical protein Thicy_0158 [Thiomicrospira cyclica ALM1]